MIRIALCDDEAFFRNQIETFINRNFKDKKEYIIDKFDNVSSLDKARNAVDYDIFLLDIVIGSENGIEYGKIIRNTNNDAKIIYITSYDRYAIYGYETRALGYILKPVNESTLVKNLALAFDSLKEEKILLPIVENNRKVIINLYDIVSVEKEGRYLILKKYDGDEYEIRDSLKNFLQRLGENTLVIQVSQSAAINMKYFKNIKSEVQGTTTNRYIILTDGRLIKVSREGYKVFKRTISKVLVEKDMIWS